ncbi:hypothetical protein Tco_0121836 [Tanacetum coccineum]
MDENAIRLLLKEHSDAFTTRLIAIQTELEATKNLVHARHGGGGDQGSMIPRLCGWTCQNLLAQIQISVRNRFGPSKYEDPQGTLSKLLQIGTVTQYQGEFEKLMNRATNVSETLLISFYISGLKPNLQRELLVAKPAMLGKAFSLARVTESRLEDQRSPAVTLLTSVATG